MQNDRRPFGESERTWHPEEPEDGYEEASTEKIVLEKVPVGENPFASDAIEVGITASINLKEYGSLLEDWAKNKEVVSGESLKEQSVFSSAIKEVEAKRRLMEVQTGKVVSKTEAAQKLLAELKQDVKESLEWMKHEEETVDLSDKIVQIRNQQRVTLEESLSKLAA